MAVQREIKPVKTASLDGIMHKELLRILGAAPW
jgi:hypothetical protein